MNQAANVSLDDAAVSDTYGSLQFDASPGNSAVASAQRHGFGLLNDREAATVPVVRLDTLHAA